MSAELFMQGRLSGESKKAYQAYLDYRDLGVSIADLQAEYVNRQKNGESSAQIPSTNKRTLEKWSSYYRWQERIKEWQAYENKQRLAAADEARLAERERRKALLDDWYETLSENISGSTPTNFKEYRALTDSLHKYFEQSRKEHNDLPTERRDITSGGKPIIEWIEPLDEDDDTGIGADELPDAEAD